MRRRAHDPERPFLENVTTVAVRFQEVDSLRVVWHGHYLSYFEEGRVAFGREYAFGYDEILRAGYVAPLVRIEIDYLAPARFGDRLEVRTRLHYTEGARISHSYEVCRAGGRAGDGAERPVLARGRSDQVFTDRQGTLVLVRPGFFREFLERCEPLCVRP